ncbi:MAG: hypothetical protein V4507_04705 [Verrucomicrobiota bacterium]
MYDDLIADIASKVEVIRTEIKEYLKTHGGILPDDVLKLIENSYDRSDAATFDNNEEDAEKLWQNLRQADESFRKSLSLF